MAKKRPIITRAFKAGSQVAQGHASTLRGAVLAATKRLMTQRIAAVEILSPRERVLAVVQWADTSFFVRRRGVQLMPRISITLHPGHKKW